MHATKIVLGCCLAATLVVAPLALAARAPSANTKSAVAFIANYDKNGEFMGWGTGFFVDDGIVITNKHVIEGGYHYRVFATGADDAVDLKCQRTLSRSGVKINLDDDVAYVRAHLDCPHGKVYFASGDPQPGDAISVLGYPYKGSVKDSMSLSQSAGTVGERGAGPWIETDAFLDLGNSGGPVVRDDRVVGVAVAKRVDADGNYIAGLFVPVSQILQGLANANDPSFGYTPQTFQNNPAYQLNLGRGPRTDDDCTLILGANSEAADDGGCRCKTGYRKDATGTMCVQSGRSSSVSSASASSSSVASRTSSASSSERSRASSSRSASSSKKAAGGQQERICERVLRLFSRNQTMLDRVNKRLAGRFGFICKG